MAEQVVKDRSSRPPRTGRPRSWPAAGGHPGDRAGVLLRADLPGVKPADVDVRFENGEMTLHGRRTPAHLGKRRALWEYEPAHYHRAFRLTEDVAADQIEAELKNGVLTVRLPKAEAAKPRRINVKGRVDCR